MQAIQLCAVSDYCVRDDAHKEQLVQAFSGIQVLTSTKNLLNWLHITNAESNLNFSDVLGPFVLVLVE